MKINSLNNPHIKYLKKLFNNHERNKLHEFLSTDLKTIKKAEKLGLLHFVYMSKDYGFTDNAYLVNEEIFNKLNIDSDIIAIIAFKKEETIIEDKLIYLDGVSDPSNLAKIIYLMDKYRYHDLALSTNSVSIYNDKCINEIKDLIFNVRIHYLNNEDISKLKENGYQIIATSLKASVYLNKLKVKDKFVLIFGSEAHGVSNALLSLSDINVKIPISNIESLNLASSVAIILDNI